LHRNEVATIGIIGAGQMGRGIAQVASLSGFNVILFDISQQMLNEGFNFIKIQLDKLVKKGKIDELVSSKALAGIKKATELVDLKSADLIIEAATENPGVKFEIFKNLAKLVGPATILASNTSSISITEIGAQTNIPDRVVGMHFMNPVPIMKLVEGIKGLETSSQTFEIIEKVAIKMGKSFVKSKDSPGFIVNRILMPMINEAIFLLQEGVASEEDIDSAMVLGTNQPMGPLALADFIGLDTCLSILEVLYKGIGEDKYRPCPLLKKFVLAGRLGKKNGRCFYNYGSS
jgi:3-hydroxybutyryl-CoA dehydrogenase